MVCGFRRFCGLMVGRRWRWLGAWEVWRLGVFECGGGDGRVGKSFDFEGLGLGGLAV